MPTKKHYSLFAIILPLIIFAACSDPTDIIAFKNVHLVTMTEETIAENQTVLVRGDRIIEFGPSNKIRIPNNTMVIEGDGSYLMPGLADMHVHLNGEWPLPQLDLYLANGVTTVRDLDGREFMQRWREEIKEGKRIGPAIYLSTPIIRGYEKNAPELVSERKSGYNCLKLYSYFSRDDYRKAMNIAKMQNLYTVGHIPLAVGLDGVIAEGMDEIAHIEELVWELIEFDRKKKLKPREWWRYLVLAGSSRFKSHKDLSRPDVRSEIEKKVREIIDKLSAADITVCTTLALDEVIVSKLLEQDTYLARPQSNYLPVSLVRALRGGQDKHQMLFKDHEDIVPLFFELCQILFEEIHKAGIPVILGTDAGSGELGVVPGFSLHDELRIVTELGLTPYDAIAACTRNAARVVEAMTGKNDFGTIAVGKRADFILVNKNPLEDVAAIKDHRGVMAAGRWYDKDVLQKMIHPSILPTIPIIGGIMNVRTAKDDFLTTIDILIGKSFSGNLPDDIDKIIVTGPNGDLPIRKVDFTFWPQFRDFYVQIPGSPAVGTYTFTVFSGNKQGSASDTLSVVRPIPVPDDSTFRPAEGEVVTSKSPTFSWGAVEYFDVPIYYLFQIYDSSGKEIYRLGRRQDLTSHTVPSGILKPGRTYSWRIRISDSGHWLEEQNRSNTKRLSFQMAQTPE